MTVVLQVSDPHFGTEQADVVAALRELAQQTRPHLLLLSGDITQRATRGQFAAARAFVDSLEIPEVVTVPGNHDIPLFNVAARLLAPYSRYRRAFGNALEREFESADISLLALNTTRWYRHIDGELSTQQIERVATHFGTMPPTRWRIVVTHQPLATPRAQDTHDLLHGHQRALLTWAAAGIDVVIGGHIHLPYVLPMHDAMPELPGRLWVVQAGTAVSNRVRAEAPNSVNLLRIAAAGAKPRQLQVEQWDYQAASRQFERVAVHRIQDNADTAGFL
jgi:3',5'-cyclic AMP phosphodiesterase CpdA